MKKSLQNKTIAELEAAIERHNRLYFEQASPEISDEEFDRLVERLKQLNPSSKILTQIGSDVSADKSVANIAKVEHSTAMLSLDKCYAMEAMVDWAKKVQSDLLVTPKMDGVALAIRYDEAGQYLLAATRGDGYRGEDVTANVRMINDVPKKLSRGSLEIRGEVFMRRSVFNKLAEKFKSPRNLAAGAIKQKDPHKTKEFNLSFCAYELLGLDLPDEKIKFKKMQALGFSVVDYEIIQNSEPELERVYQAYFKKRENLDYEIDGVVYRASLHSEQVRLGASAHHPRWAMAYKFQGDAAESILREIEWSVSRTSTITPIGIVDPVKLSGAIISRISLHNVGMINKIGLTLRAKVLVVRSGGVIPYLEKVVKSGTQEIKVPKLCPSCHQPTQVVEDFLYCTNSQGCRETQMGRLKHFIQAIEIEEVGEKLIEQLYDTGKIIEPHDFYRLTVEDLLPLERMGEILAKKIIRNIQARRQVSLETFLIALGIPELAGAVSKVLVKEFGTLEKIRQLTEDELKSIHTIGPVTAQSVVKGLKDSGKEIAQLLKYVQLTEKKWGVGKLGGKTFLFTGAMSAMPRKEAEDKVISLGGEIAASVNKDLDYLVVGEEGYKNREKGNKWIKAEALIGKGAKIKIIPEAEFLKLIED